MKKRIFIVGLAIGLILSMAAPVLAAEEPACRLAEYTNVYGYTYSFTYENGGVLPSEVHDYNGKYAIVYDDAGHVLSRTFEFPEVASDTYAYDENGKLLESTRKDLSEETHSVYTFDEDGTMWEEYTSSVQTVNGEPRVEKKLYEYTLDDRGDAVMRMTHEEDYMTDMVIYSYTYDDQGNILTKAYSLDGTPVSESRYIYTPLLTVEIRKYVDKGRYAVNFDLTAALDRGLLGSSSATSQTEPVLTFDDNGDLTQIDITYEGEPKSITFAYEPVA